jgi:hypothetical protein
MTFSMPFAFPISSATDFTPLPATKAVIEPPIFVPAVTAANEAGWNFPSFCSRTANVEAKRAKAEYAGTAMGWDCRSCDRADRRTELRAAGSMMMARKEVREPKRSLGGVSKATVAEQSIDLRTAEHHDLGLTRLDIRR